MLRFSLVMDLRTFRGHYPEIGLRRQAYKQGSDGFGLSPTNIISSKNT